MAHSTQVPSTSQSIPKASKKRKNDSDTSSKSKKKLKHMETNGDSEQTLGTDLTKSKKDKTKRRDTKEKQKAVHHESVPVSETASEAEQNGEDVADVEMLDTEPSHIPTSPTMLNGLSQPNDDVELLQPDLVEEVDDTMLTSTHLTSFTSKRISLYVSIPAISLASPTSSLLSVHLTPLLLTYFPPAGGIVVAFSDPVLSASPEAGLNKPLQPPHAGKISQHPTSEIFAQCADQFGVCWVWLTVTLLVFAPRQGDELKAWINVQSESFVGLVSYNYFQTSVSKERIPKTWLFDGPTQEQKRKRSRKGKLRGEDAHFLDGDATSSQVEVYGEQAETGAGGGDGVFRDETGEHVKSTQNIRVAGIEVVPGSERSKFGMQIEGSLLSTEEEAALVARERHQYDIDHKRKMRSQTPAAADDEGLPLMSGAVSISREASIVS